MRGRKPAEVASREAYEEAGLIGEVVGKRPLGNFHYEKRLAKKEAIICEVRVFLFRVEQQLDDWPERGERERKWFDASEAVALVEEGGLAEIMARFANSYVSFGAGRRSRARHKHGGSGRIAGSAGSGRSWRSWQLVKLQSVG